MPGGHFFWVNFVEFRAREVRRICYSTDLPDGEWECLGLYVPAQNRDVRLITHSAREILRAIFYVLEDGRPGSMVSKPAAKSLLVARAEQWSHEGVVVDW